MTSTDPNWLKPRGVLQRNAGIQWIKDHFDPNHQRGVVYFADDDNTYDLQIFEEVNLLNVLQYFSLISCAFLSQ